MPELPTVAIVEDDEAVRQALADLMIVSGLRCHQFGDAGSFLSALLNRDFDCLVTDIRMPGMNGIDLIQRLHEERVDLPVIVLSSVLDLSTRMHAISLGVRAWFCKPVTDDRLLSAINAAIGGGPSSRGKP
ncbi:response regulator [uncultured Parasphingorhabdus sp.]|uniref:response regulator transcription factor n=1 Tax=uncultured Parasphingorhabdus sp. TaxID=2709694 RepID=UPI0030D8190B